MFSLTFISRKISDTSLGSAFRNIKLAIFSFYLSSLCSLVLWMWKTAKFVSSSARQELTPRQWMQKFSMQLSRTYQTKWYSSFSNLPFMFLWRRWTYSIIHIWSSSTRHPVFFLLFHCWCHCAVECTRFECCLKGYILT